MVNWLVKQQLVLPFDKLKLIYLKEVSSTNDYLILNHQKLSNYTVLRTDYQTNGRGQFLRTWTSNKSENLLFSILLKNILIIDIDNIKKIIIESIMEFLSKYNLKPKFKLPNDILVNNKKIVGILIETLTKSHYEYKYVVIGIGININQTEFNDLIATSLKLETKKDYNLDDLFYEILTIIFKKLTK